MIGPTADLLSLVYAVVALYTLWQLPGRPPGAPPLHPPPLKHPQKSGEPSVNNA